MKERETLFEIIKESCLENVCDNNLKEKQSNSNPCCGQSSIIAMVINSAMDGKIMMCQNNGKDHYYNIVNGELIDLVFDEYEGIVPQYNKSSATSITLLLSDEDIKDRFKKLLSKVHSKLMMNNFDRIYYSEEINNFRNYLNEKLIFSGFEIDEYSEEKDRETMMFDFVAQNTGNIYHVSRDKESGTYSYVQRPAAWTLLGGDSALPDEILDTVFNVGRENKVYLEYERKLMNVESQVK